MKYLKILSVLLTTMIASVLHSQSPGTDTAGKVWIPRANALKTLERAQLYKVYKDYVELLKKDTTSLAGRVRELSGAIENQKNTIASYQRDSVSYAKIEVLYKGKDSLAAKEISKWQIAYKKEHRKLRWASIGGVLATAAAIIVPFLHK